MRHILSILSFGVMAVLGLPVILSTIAAVFFTIINFGVSIHLIARRIPYLEIAIEPFTLLSPVLTLLLVFDTNASYQRFDEARKVWGLNVNRYCDLAWQTITWIMSPEDKEKRQCILRCLKAYPYFMKHHLTQGGSIGEVAGILSQEETEAISNAQNRPIYVLQIISEIINTCRLTKYERVSMDRNLTQFHGNVGACEKIFKTLISVAYTQLTS